MNHPIMEGNHENVKRVECQVDVIKYLMILQGKFLFKFILCIGTLRKS